MTKDLFDKGDDNSVRLLTLDLLLAAVSPLGVSLRKNSDIANKRKKEITESLEA